MRFSPSTKGWYPEFIDYPDLPGDIVHVEDDVYQALLGKQLEAGPDGQPREHVAPQVDPREELKRAAAAKRWEVMMGGTVIGGVRVPTGSDDRARLTEVLVGAPEAGMTDATVVDFKAPTGFASMTIGQVRQLVGAIGLFTQACYSAERAHHEAIDALTDAELGAYDVRVGWPQ